jgi:hypothetical protein
MKWRPLYASAVLIAALLAAVFTSLVGPAARASGSSNEPLSAENFKQAAPRGFGDRNNSWAHSMAWWHGHLYVGTARQDVCLSEFAVWDAAVLNLGLNFANAYLPYPPSDPDLSCAPDGADLSLQAEIWRWTPRDNSWTRVFQSPLAVDNPGPAGKVPEPPQVMWQGKKLPYEDSFRALAPFTEPDGTEALYAFGVTTGIIWNGDKLPLPRILRSVDGVTFTPVPQTPGTFLGTLSGISDHSSYRSPASYGNKLFVLAGSAEGNGGLIASADPAKGDNAWFLASAPGVTFYELAVFNGWLYLGGFDMVNGQNLGYTVLKTRAEGPPPYTLITVVPRGAYLAQMPSTSVVSMHVYEDRLYVGTSTFSEVIRINPDDTWDLVVGSPRTVPLPNGGSEWKYPLSGLDGGFGHTPNDHIWQMEDFDSNLYLGTFNLATSYRHDPTAGSLLLPHMGANLYRSHDGGWYYSAVTTTGFAKPDDPTGGIFDYGIRTMASTPYGLFVGTTNDYFGLAIFRGPPLASTLHGFSPGSPRLTIFPGTPGTPSAPPPPARVEMEPLKDGSALLSWEVSPGARQYQIWRAERHPIFIRAVSGVEGIVGFISPTIGDIPDVYVGPYQQIGVTKDTVFVDSTVQAGQRYMYYVLAEARDAKGRNPESPAMGPFNIIDPGSGAVLGTVDDPSDQSNLVAFPLLTPPVTFAQLSHELDVLDKRRRFRNSETQLLELRKMIANAQRLAGSCRIPAAIARLHPQEAFSGVHEPEATDLEILIAKLVRRLQLFNRFPGQVVADEFCSQP